MVLLLVIILAILYITGSYHIFYFPYINSTLFVLFGRAITLSDIFIFAIIVWLIGLLPRPFKEILGVLFLIWLLAFFGIIGIAGLANIVILVIILGLVLYLFGL